MTAYDDLILDYIIKRGGKFKASECAKELYLTPEIVEEAVERLAASGKLKAQQTFEGNVSTLTEKKKQIEQELLGLPAKLASGTVSPGQYTVKRAELERALSAVKKAVAAAERHSPGAIAEAGSEPSVSIDSVRDLVQERDRVLGWLDKLEEMKDQLSEEVYKGRLADYSSRRDRVEVALQSHLPSMEGRLGTALKERQELSKQREELLARHKVGELPEAPFRAQFVQLEEKLAKVGKDIEKLEEIVSKGKTLVFERPLGRF